MEDSVHKKHGKEKLEKGINIGRKEGKKEGIEQTAINMLKSQTCCINDICSITSLYNNDALKLKNKVNTPY